MPVITERKKTEGPIERFVGGNARILNSSQPQIGNNISVQWHEVLFPQHAPPDEQGKLFLFPVDDERFCIELYYIVFMADPAQNDKVLSLKFYPEFFDQFPAGEIMNGKPFSHGYATEMQFPVCAISTSMLDELYRNEGLDVFSKLLHQSQMSIGLLKRALDCISIPFTVCQVPACRFLAHESEREKIELAQTIIAAQIDKPLTIKELSRKVAMNECYLKKGFKALTGKTIHEYQQEHRIDKARQLLSIQGQTVTEVALQLGFSSISHFSTAFKRVTGMKPCELLA